MTTFLEEVPGARERPGGSAIRIGREKDGTARILLPASGLSPVVLLFSGILSVNLLLTLYTGLVLIFFHKSVLFMAEISPSGLPVSLLHWDWALLVGLLGAEALGVWTLAAILRPLTARETVEIGQEWLVVRHSGWGRTQERRLTRADVRGFRLQRDPQGMDSSTLWIEGRGERINIGEFLREAEREWLVSAGNALLAQTA